MAPLVIGTRGQLGTVFMNLLDDAVALTRRHLDLANATPDEIRDAIRNRQPSAVINCAAYTNVDKAETEEELATRINGAAVGWIAQAAADLGVPFVTFSTDYVFDGAAHRPYVESDPTNPINAYGRSKLLGEHAALEAYPQALVVRTSWVLSATHRNFVTAILQRARQGQPLKVVDDQTGKPTIADDLARGTWKAAELGASGLLHLTNQGQTTWYRLARHALQHAGLEPNLATPCTTAEYPTPAPRPAHSVLESERLDTLGLEALPPWQVSIDRVVAGSLRLLEEG